MSTLDTVNINTVLIISAIFAHVGQSYQLPGGLGPEALICKTRNPYLLSYRKDLPWGEDIERDVQLDDITDGRATVLALHTAHCLYCTTQAKYLGNMARDLESYGTNISIIVINRAGYEDYIPYYMKHIKMFDHVYFMQDNWETNAWRDLRGRKDDFYVYDTSQRLVMHKTGYGVSLTNFGWKDELYDLLSRIGTGSSDCDGGQDQEGQQTYVESEFRFPRDDECHYNDVVSDTLRLQAAAVSVLYFVDASIEYSVSQAKEIVLLSQRWSADSVAVQIVLVNADHAQQHFSNLQQQIGSISTSTDVIQDNLQLQIFTGLEVNRDDMLIYDGAGRLVFYNRAPKTDMFNNVWRDELTRLVTSGNQHCPQFQLRKLKCLRGEDWQYNDLPFHWMTFERFTVLSILKEGEEGIAQFEHVIEARAKMGHFPITHIVINPSTPGGLQNSWRLRQLEENSRVHFIEDYTQADLSIVNKLYGAGGDVLYYGQAGVMRARDTYSSQYDLLNRIRTEYTAADEPCEV